MAAIIFQNLRLMTAANIFTRGVSKVSAKYKKRLMYYDRISRLANFAIDQHNNKENTNLKFVKGVHMTWWPYSAVRKLHIVTFKAMDGEKVDVYKAKIREPSWLREQELMEFKLIGRRFSLVHFAIDQYNKQENANLKFVKGICRKIYLVAGKLYHFKFEASDGEKVNVYKAEVRERIYEQRGFMLTPFERRGFILTQFKLVGGSPSVDSEKCPKVKSIGGAPSVDSEKCPKVKSILNSIFVKFRASAASILARGFSQSLKDLTTPTGVMLNPINPPTTYNLACFAVDQHNIKNKENANLKFVRGIDSEEVRFGSKRYYVTLEANDGDKVNVYQAVILDRPCMNEQQLLMFELVGEAPSLF